MSAESVFLGATRVNRYTMHFDIGGFAGIISSENTPRTTAEDTLGTIITLTGVSGAGKTRITAELLKALPDARMIPSFTTRAPRASDLPGEYRYVTTTEMDALRMRKNGQKKLLWTRERDGGKKTYATARADIMDELSRDGGYGIMILVPDVLRILYWFIVEEQGYADQYFVPLFIRAPDADELRQRVRERGQDPAEFESVWHEERNWEADARRSPMGFTMIDNTQTGIATAVEQIRNRIESPFSLTRARQKRG
jgi:guanylate kinase